MGITFIQTILFGSKLKQLLLINDKSQKNIIILTNIGTRIIGLISVSLLFTILHFISTLLVLHYNNSNKFIVWIDGYTTIIDIFGNYLCVLLALKSHKKLYYNLCALVDILCKHWWDVFIAIFYNQKRRNIKMLGSSVNDTTTSQHTTTKTDGTIKTSSKDSTLPEIHLEIQSS